MIAREKLAIVMASTAVGLLFLVRSGSWLIHYSIGAGWLDYLWVASAGPVLSLAVALFSPVVLLTMSLLTKLRIELKVVALATLASLVLTFVTNPSGKNGDAYICRGLVHRISKQRAAPKITNYVMSLVAQHSFHQDDSFDVTKSSPGWLRDLFPERNLSVLVYTGTENAPYTRIQVGSPLIHYGCVVSTSGSVVLPPGTATLIVNCNIIVFAQ